MKHRREAFPLLFILLAGAGRTTAFSSLPDSTTLFKEFYQDRAGYAINTEEREAIDRSGASAVYGEITPEGTALFMRELEIGPNDVFYDLGCGVGKMVFQLFLDGGVKKSVGIELSPTRIAHAQDVAQKMHHLLTKVPERTLTFHKQDLLDADLSDATALYVASTCFSDAFMKKLIDKVARLKPGLKLVTLTRLPEPHPFKLEKQMRVPMSWSQTTTAYLYRLPESSSKG